MYPFLWKEGHDSDPCLWLQPQRPDQPPSASDRAPPVPLCHLVDLVRGRAQVPVLDFTDSITKASLLSHTLLPCPAILNILSLAVSVIGSRGNRNTCFPELMLLICPWNWCLSEKQTFLYTAQGPFQVLTRNKFVGKNDEPTQRWQCDDVLRKYTEAMLLLFFSFRKISQSLTQL